MKNKSKRTKSDDQNKRTRNTKKPNLNTQLTEAINVYNNQYDLMNEEGINLYHQRDKSIYLIEFIETLINSISNHPKEFDKDFKEINEVRKTFIAADHFVKKELETARKQAIDAGVGVVAGAGVAAITPSVAMWAATTFGTASTGTAISALSGAAATNAALAWLGGGAVTAGGLGMAGGKALLALAGPIGWGIAGVSILTSVVLFANRKLKSNKEKAKEIEVIKKNTERLKEMTTEICTLAEKTVAIKDQLTEEYKRMLGYFDCDYSKLKDNQKMLLAALVNNTKSLAVLIGTTVDIKDIGE